MNTDYPDVTPFPLDTLTAAVNCANYTHLPKLGLDKALQQRMPKSNLRFLHLAAYNGSLKTLDFTAEDLLNCLTFDSTPRDALHFAAHTSLEDIVGGVTVQQLERSQKGNTQYTTLMLAIENGQLPYVTKPISAVTLANHVGDAGWTALHAAVENHNLLLVDNVTTTLLHTTKQHGESERTAYEHLAQWAAGIIPTYKDNFNNHEDPNILTHVSNWFHPLYTKLFRDDHPLAVQIATTISQDWPKLQNKATLWLAQVLSPTAAPSRHHNPKH